MGILGGALEGLNINDLNRLCADEIPEGTEVEYKSALPVKTGRGLDAWHENGSIGEYARNEIAEEIIAFANTFGGVLCVGIQESNDHPKRAAGLQPLPRVHDLARRLRQAVYGIIDPPLPMLEAIGIVSDEAGQGVVVMRVPPSRRKPHRHNVSKEVFYRRADETVRISMREIQELTVQTLTEATRLETVIADRRRHHREAAAKWINAPKEEGPGWGVAVQYLAVPATAIDLGRVVGRPRLTELDSIVVATMPDKAIRLKWSHLPHTEWRPGLRSISNVNKDSSTRRADYALYTDGRCEVSCFFSLTQTLPFVAAGWLVGGLGVALSWVDRIRREAGTAGEYVVACQLSMFGKAASLMGYTAGNPDDYATLPVGHFDLPLMSVGASEEGDLLLQRFNEDIWNLAGRDVQSGSPKFSMP
jgi:hypothetical protein